MKKLRCAVIGVGMGRWHIESFLGHPACEVVAAADTDEGRLRERTATFEIPSLYTDPDELIRKETPDIVCIATPNVYHKSLTLAALEAGCHVICEKPMALNAEDAQVMLNAAKAAGKRLMVNFSFRFTPQAWALKKEVEQGLLGDVYYGRSVWHRRLGMPCFSAWFGQKAVSGGGALIDLGIHRLDLALWLMGYPEPSWVMASTYDRLARGRMAEDGRTFDVEDFAVALIRFANGATLELEASWAAHIAEQEMMETRLLGTEAGLVQRNVKEGYEFEAEIYLTRNGVQYDMKPRGSFRGCPPSAMHHLADCLIEDRPHIATAEEGVVVMKLLDAIYRSAREGRPVEM